MKLQTLLTIALFIHSLPGVTTSTLTATNSAILTPIVSLWTSNDGHLLADFDWTEMNNTLAAAREASVDTNVRAALPNSYYAIRFQTTDGTWRRHNGVAILNNALLSSDHILPSHVKLEEVVQIQIISTTGEIHDIWVEDGFILQRIEGYTLITFRNPIIPTENIAPIGDADELNQGTMLNQTVIVGAEKGTYPTFIRDQFIAQAIDGQPYPALRVSPDKTVVGDSGDPLYVDGVVYCINNAGDGVCGAITDPDGIYQLAEELTNDLAGQHTDIPKETAPEHSPASSTAKGQIARILEPFVISPKEPGTYAETIAE